MPVDPDLLAQALSTPLSRDVSESPIVRAVILSDPAHARDLVGFLDEPESLEAANAKTILCLFDSDAAVPLLRGLREAGPRGRKRGLEVLWALLVAEPAVVIRGQLEASREGMGALLADRRALPDDGPPEVEREFVGRVCDLAYAVVEQLLSPSADLSLFRSLDQPDRDEQIRRLSARGFGLRIV